MSEKKARKDLAKLQKAMEKFNQAITDFNSAYNPDSVGLNEWIDYNSEVLSDIEQDIDSRFEGDE
jgi:regulator of sigma D